MKCAKCGHEVDPSSPNCPYCAAGGKRQRRDEVRCPKCGSDRVEDVPAPWWQTGGPGCMLSLLGLLAWLWLSIFDLTPRDHVCLDCGSRWGTPFRTWMGLLALALTAALIAGILFAWLPVLAVAAATLVLIGVVSVVFMLLFTPKN